MQDLYHQPYQNLFFFLWDLVLDPNIVFIGTLSPEPNMKVSVEHDP